MIKNEIEGLTKELQHHNYLYHVKDDPIITDEEYDKKFQRLLQLEKKHPKLKVNNSPTNKVGNTVKQSLFKIIEHTTPMLSLDNVFNLEDFNAFYKRIHTQIKEDKLDFIVEHKFDGLALNLTYVDGVLMTAATRGDGHSGEDVTLNALTIETIPKMLNTSKQGIIEIRGEVLMSKAVFNSLNNELLESGKKPFVNTRNAAAGSLRQKDPEITKNRKLDFYAYSIGSENAHLDLFNNQFQLLLWFKEQGFNVSNNYLTDGTNLGLLFKDLAEERYSLPYDIDGLVIKLNSFQQHELMGALTRAPRWAVAYKFTAEIKQSFIKDVIFQVGRTGVLTPVARIEPVFVGGTTISNVTLHNMEEIRRKDIKIGDYVNVRRAGDVVPEITTVVIEKRTKKVRDVIIPNNCPVCNSLVIKDVDKVYYRCSNTIDCPAQQIEKFIHFVSRKAMNIDGLGDKIIEEMINSKIVKTFDDLYRLNEKQLMSLSMVGNKLATKIIRNIEDSKNTTFERFIYSLGIPNLGAGTALRLNKQYKDISQLFKASINDLEAIEDIGSITASNIVIYLQNETNKNVIYNLLELGVTWNKDEVSQTNKPLANHTYVITGTLTNYTREQLELKLTNLGATISNSVNKNTTALIVGEKPGSKLAKAITLNTPIFNEDKLTDLTEL